MNIALDLILTLHRTESLKIIVDSSVDLLLEARRVRPFSVFVLIVVGGRSPTAVCPGVLSVLYGTL